MNSRLCFLSNKLIFYKNFFTLKRYVILSTTPLNSANDSESFPNYDEHLLEAKATIIEWILNISHSPMESANVKLALMYEFLTFSQFQSMNYEDVVKNYGKIVLSPSHTELCIFFNYQL